MSSDLFSAMDVSASGMRAQSERMRVITENVANANTTADTPGGEPYRRKLVDFDTVMQSDGATAVEVDEVYESDGDLPQKRMPDHPAANEQGLVKMPNVDTLIEMTDMREAQRSHQASLRAFDNAKQMVTNTLSILR